LDRREGDQRNPVQPLQRRATGTTRWKTVTTEEKKKVGPNEERDQKAMGTKKLGALRNRLKTRRR